MQERDEQETVQEGRTRRTKGRYVVAIYLCDQAYGGPEEGGWWFDTGRLERVLRVFRSAEPAYAYARRANRLLHVLVNRDRREITSVLSEGRYHAETHEDVAPQSYPDTRPHYE